MFLFATATIGIKSGVFPRWFSILSYLLGAILLLAVSFVDWAILVLPAWVAVVSVFILLRERAAAAGPPDRPRAPGAGTRPPTALD